MVSQRGGNVQAGVAASASSGALGGAAALGGGYSTSSGTRELTADTAQRISDAFSQATSAVRELRSTVVVQGSQAEAARAQTRVVANYNHGHALTIMYYEVLRHYRVLTRLVASQLAGGFILTVSCAWLLRGSWRNLAAASSHLKMTFPIDADASASTSRGLAVCVSKSIRFFVACSTSY